MAARGPAPFGSTVGGFRTGFLAAVLLLAGGAAFTIWNEVRTYDRIEALVDRSLERERLIGLIRLDAELLAQAVNDHIEAADDDERKSADAAMEVILNEITVSSERYSASLPRNEADLWRRLTTVSETLVKTVDVAVKYSNRKEAERARKHLQQEVKPINFELDEIAAMLARQNAEETRRVLRELESIRLRTTALAAAVVGVALVLSLLVMLRVTRTLQRQQDTIAAQLEELGRRNAELDSFASRVAHDLVAPLSPLKGYLTLARRSAESAEVKELLHQAESSTARMSELVEALLRFCRAGRTIDRAYGELDTAVTTILLEASQSAEAAKVQLERAIEPSVAAQCPPQLLQSVAQNLVSNAVKYTAGRPDARVVVRVLKERGSAVLEVTDNGPGMSDESQRQLFQPFFRAPEARSMPGHGLGMATTKRLVEAHGGSIEVKSALGAGTQVTVRLPLAERR